MSMSRSEAREEAYYARQDRNASLCQCGSPDWPGTCPGPANCPCVRGDAEEGADE
jgi:hypothetical protein